MTTTTVTNPDDDEPSDELQPWETDEEVFNPAHKAHQMRIQGFAWREITQQCGYTSVMSAAHAVKKYLQVAGQQASEQQRRDALDLELARLDALQERWWYAATHGDDKAAQVVLKVMSHRSSLLQLDMGASESKGGSKTILVMGKREDYTQTLKEIIDGQHDEPEVEDE